MPALPLEQLSPQLVQCSQQLRSMMHSHSTHKSTRVSRSCRANVAPGSYTDIPAELRPALASRAGKWAGISGGLEGPSTVISPASPLLPWPAKCSRGTSETRVSSPMPCVSLAIGLPQPTCRSERSTVENTSSSPSQPYSLNRHQQVKPSRIPARPYHRSPCW